MKEKNITAFLNNDERKDLLRFLTAGSVDDGKSTLIGRLLYDSKKLYEDQLSELVHDSKRYGLTDSMNYALLLDGLKAEREEGITIDVAYRYFSTNKRKFIIADTPGHEQYTRNMITGGSTAHLAILLVDARNGITTQTKRHTYLVSLLGIKHVILAVNKMDLVAFSEARFQEIVEAYRELIAPLNIADLLTIPLSALHGDNVVRLSDRMPWYTGESLLNTLEHVSVENDSNLTDFRFPVQYVLRPDSTFRGYSGKIVSGIIRKGNEVVALPSGKRTHVRSIITYDGEQDYAFPPQSVTLTLEDEIDLSRGDMLVFPHHEPTIDRYLDAMLVWMDEEPMNQTKSFFLKQTTNVARTTIDHVQYTVDVNTMEHSAKTSSTLILNQIARVTLVTAKPIFFDAFKQNKAMGAFILIDPITHHTSAVGMIIGPMAEKNTLNVPAVPIIDTMKLGIHPDEMAVVDKIVNELNRQGIAIEIIK